MPALAQALSAGEWRTFEVITTVELLKASGVSHIWLPAALIRDTPYQKTHSNRFDASAISLAWLPRMSNETAVTTRTAAASSLLIFIIGERRACKCRHQYKLDSGFSVIRRLTD